jgi:hypothetical protein
MTGPRSYDDFLARELTDHPTATEVGAALRDLRAHRRALQALCDDAKNCQSAEPDVEVANQMEETVQNVAGALLQLDKAIPALERVQGNLTRYAEVIERMKGIVESVRSGRGTTS